MLEGHQQGLCIYSQLSLAPKKGLSGKSGSLCLSVVLILLVNITLYLKVMMALSARKLCLSSSDLGAH